ncbi:MAG: hypothetical protein JW753_00625 [Dehalococcoidia bacterium]|nr:hypothetical protein [Dehalococcoidia bacterium]
MGRFISADTVVPDFSNPQSLNRYSYCWNNALPTSQRCSECTVQRKLPEYLMPNSGNRCSSGAR